jgi:hypothetical protein
MAIEPININLDKLKAKLKERYPDYDFDKPVQLDRKCKLVPEGRSCPKKQDRPIVIDNNKNEMCVYLFKHLDEKSQIKSDRRCYAIVTTEEERTKYEQGTWYEGNR